MQRLGSFTGLANHYSWYSEWEYSLYCYWTLFRPDDAHASWPPYPPQAFTEGPIADGLRRQRAEFQAAETLVSNLAWRIRSRFENKGEGATLHPAIAIKDVTVPDWMNHAIIDVEDQGTPPGGLMYKIVAEEGELQYTRNRAGADTAVTFAAVALRTVITDQTLINKSLNS